MISEIVKIEKGVLENENTFVLSNILCVYHSTSEQKSKVFFEKNQKFLTKHDKRFCPIVIIYSLLYQKSEIFQRFLMGKFPLF